MQKLILLALCANICISILNYLKTKKLMSTQERVDAALGRLDEATTEIASDLKKLRDEIAAGNVSEESLAKLDENVATLEKLGQEPVVLDAPEENL